MFIKKKIFNKISYFCFLIILFCVGYKVGNKWASLSPVKKENKQEVNILKNQEEEEEEIDFTFQERLMETLPKDEQEQLDEDLLLVEDKSYKDEEIKNIEKAIEQSQEIATATLETPSKILIATTSTPTPTILPTQPIKPINIEKKEKEPKERQSYYILQVSSTQNKEKAENLAAKIAREGFHSFILPVKLADMIWYRVCIKSVDYEEAIHIGKYLQEINLIDNFFVTSHTSN